MSRTSRTNVLVSISTVLALAAALALPTGSALATCGGGGGGGVGGARAGSTATDQAYQVPWKVLQPGTAAPEGALVLYWFPTSAAETRGSDLLASRVLSVASGQCVGMALVTLEQKELRANYGIAGDSAVAVLAASDGTEAGRVTASGKSGLDTGEIEKLVTGELDRRSDTAKATLDAAKEKTGAGDVEGAAALYQQVYDLRCLLPGEGRKAAKALKKLGRPIEETSSLAPNLEGDAVQADLSEPTNTQMVALMQAGLQAEISDRYLDARRYYRAAHELDPNDGVALRYLGELYRHHTGEWDLARAAFDAVLAGPADPISRAVALHGLGKMTIHAGRSADGLALFEQSVAAWPLALTYRNMAVFWNSEGQTQKAYGYVKQALALDPQDDYNQIFAATYLVQLGRPAEAAEIAKRYEGMLAASYNLAAIQAQLGNRDEALRLLSRHFHAYEQFDQVRAHEMKEAREDIVFASLQKDPAFIQLTAMADALRP